ncbi:MAG: cell wall hydrolase [Prevotella sp.]
MAKYSAQEVTLVAQTVWGEAGNCSREEQMLVAWCICNRADAYDKSVEEIVTAPKQFIGYSPSNPVDETIVEVVSEVLEAWSRGEEALVLSPYATTSSYLFFYGDGKHNWFREEL